MPSVFQWQYYPLITTSLPTRILVAVMTDSTVLVYRDKLMVTGGYSWNTILGRVETLDMGQEAPAWDTLPTLNTPRYCIGQGSKEIVAQD